MYFKADYLKSTPKYIKKGSFGTPKRGKCNDKGQQMLHIVPLMSVEINGNPQIYVILQQSICQIK